MPVRLTLEPEGAVAWPVHNLGSGSHLVVALHRAEGFAVVPAGTGAVAKGDLVEVTRL
jgi:molybdopterin molybdotransferase